MSAILYKNYRLEVANPTWRVSMSNLEAELVLGVLDRKGGEPQKGGVLWVSACKEGCLMRKTLARSLRWARPRDGYRRIPSESYRCDSNR